MNVYDGATEAVARKALNTQVSLLLKYIHTYIIDHSPLGLFRANETNN